jgi:hypothetical protein
MLYLYHWFHFSFSSQSIWFCFAGHWSALDSASTHWAPTGIFPKLLLQERCGAAADGQVVAVVGLASPCFNYLLGTTPGPWWWWLLALATPPFRWSPWVPLFLYVLCCNTVAVGIMYSAFVQFGSYLFNFTWRIVASVKNKFWVMSFCIILYLLAAYSASGLGSNVNYTGSINGLWNAFWLRVW